MKRDQLIQACSCTTTKVVEYLIDAISAADISGGIIPYPVPAQVNHLCPEERRNYVTKEAIALVLFLSDERNHPLWEDLRASAKQKFGDQCNDQTYVECIGKLNTDEN